MVASSRRASARRAARAAGSGRVADAPGLIRARNGGTGAAVPPPGVTLVVAGVETDALDVTGVPVKDFNARLKKLRKRAKKAAAGKGGGSARRCYRRWRELKHRGAKKTCCGKDHAKRCKDCPRNHPELVLAPW